MPRKWREKEVWKTENVMEDLRQERSGKTGKKEQTTAKDRSWRLVIGREKSEEMKETTKKDDRNYG